MKPLWRIRLLNGPELESASGERISHFRSRKVGALIAYLCLNLGKRCSREQVASDLWPDEVDQKVLSNRLRFTISSLRRQLEPEGVGYGTVLEASVPGFLQLNPDKVWCDVFEINLAMNQGRIQDAFALLSGSLMPGYYDEWLREEQIRFELLIDEHASTRPIHRLSSIPEKPLLVPIEEPSANLPNHLPVYLTSFVGRELEVEQIKELIDQNRLVTLTGPGGIGKTRLMVEVSRHFASGCFFVSLAELSNADRLEELVLGKLGIAQRAGIKSVAIIANAIESNQISHLILDNAEHVVDAVSEFVLRLLGRISNLRIVVTSRQRLELSGETVFTVSPLGSEFKITPNPTGELHPAIQLFVNRAKTVRPDFRLTSTILESVHEICRLTEGLPLAVELAAVRITAQSPSQIAESLKSSLLELKARQRDVPSRHRSLRAAIQGSYELIEPKLQKAFCQCSVFQSTWNLLAASYVVDVSQVEQLMEDLVVRSLVLLLPGSMESPPRFTYLEALRQFASEQISIKDRDEAMRQHSNYFLRLAAQADQGDLRTFPALDQDIDNIIVAFARAKKPFKSIFWEGLAGALEYAFVRGLHRQAVRWIEEYSSEFCTIVDPQIRIRVRNGACQFLPDLGRLEETNLLALEMESDSIEIGDRNGVIYAQVVKGYVAEFTGDLDSAVNIQRNALVEARSTNNIQLLETCLAHASGTLHDVATRMPEGVKARQAMLQEAEELARELIALVKPFSRRKPLAHLLLGTALYIQERFDEALQAYSEAQQSALELGTTTEPMYAYGFSSEILYKRGNLERSAQLFGAFLYLQEAMGYSVERAEFVRPSWTSHLEANLKSRLGIPQFQIQSNIGRTLARNPEFHIC